MASPSNSAKRQQKKVRGRKRSPTKAKDRSTSPVEYQRLVDDAGTGWKADLWKVGGLFVFAIVSLIALLSLVVFSGASQEELDSLVLPTSLQEAQKLGRFLSLYSQKHPISVAIGHAACYLFLQTFAIPGTIFFNLIGGALYGVTLGYPLCLLYNTVGSIMLYMVSKYFGHRLIDHFFRDKLEELRRKLDSHRGDMVWYMTSMRIFPFTPNWFMNVSSPHLHIPVRDFSLAILMGLTPYNFLSCKAGMILGELRSKSEIIDTSTTIQLVMVAVAGFVVPRLFRNRVIDESQVMKHAA